MKWTFIVLVIIGVWIVFSPFILGFSDLNLPSWNNVIFGMFVILFSLWSHYISKGSGV